MDKQIYRMNSNFYESDNGIPSDLKATLQRMDNELTKM